MSPPFRPAAAARHLALAARQVNPFAGLHTLTPTPSSTTATPDTTPLPTATADWAEVYHSGYSKYYSDYSEFYHHATMPTALSNTVTATTTVTGAGDRTTATATAASTTSGAAFDHADGGHGGGHASGLGSPAIAGIAVGSVVGLSILGALLVWFCLRGRQQVKDGEAGHDQGHDQGHDAPAPSPPPPMMDVAALNGGLSAVPRLPSPFRQRHTLPGMHALHAMHAGSEEETVAFAKVNSTAPARSVTDEDPPAYEETEGLARRGAFVNGASVGSSSGGGGGGGGSLAYHMLSPELAAGTVSDGFRPYRDSVVHDTESKPYDPLAPSS